jgi:hypothetical protein
VQSQQQQQQQPSQQSQSFQENNEETISGSVQKNVVVTLSNEHFALDCRLSVVDPLSHVPAAPQQHEIVDNDELLDFSSSTTGSSNSQDNDYDLENDLEDQQHHHRHRSSSVSLFETTAAPPDQVVCSVAAVGGVSSVVTADLTNCEIPTTVTIARDDHNNHPFSTSKYVMLATHSLRDVTQHQQSHEQQQHVQQLQQQQQQQQSQQRLQTPLSSPLPPPPPPPPSSSSSSPPPPPLLLSQSFVAFGMNTHYVQEETGVEDHFPLLTSHFASQVTQFSADFTDHFDHLLPTTFVHANDRI